MGIMYTEDMIKLIAIIILSIILMVIWWKKKGKIGLILAIISILVAGGFGMYSANKYINEIPALTLKGDNQITLQANAEYADEGAQANYHREDVTGQIIKTGEVDTSKPGTYTIKYKYEYKGKEKIVERTVIIEDKEIPTLELKGKKEITMYKDEEYKEPGYTAKDNVDGDITDKVTSEKKEIDDDKYEIEYIVKDSSGNEATEKRTVKLKERKKVEVKEEKELNVSNTETSSGGKNKTGVIYLTFDDGPSSSITPKILDILKDENVKATFFLVNYSSSNEKLVKREVNEGHSVGIHGYSHDYKQIYQSVDTYMNNITKLQDKIKKSTGVTTYITRFPGGSSNTVSKKYCKGIMTKLTKEVVNRGYYYYDWNVSSGDAGGAKTSKQVYNNVTKRIKPNRNNIVLMHDFSGNIKTLNALRAIIQYGKKNNYTFKKITTETPMVKHGVNN